MQEVNVNQPLDVDSSNEINFETDVIIDGKQYWQSPAQELAKYICKKNYDEFRLTAEYGFSHASVFMERILTPGTFFSAPKYSEKKCIGMLLFDIEQNKITLRKTMVDTDKHEFHADEKRGMDDCFGVQYDIFKYLRDSDLIEIHAIERKVRHKEKFVYVINKLKAVRKGRFLHFNGYGTQFFIPKAEFKCYEKGKVKEKRTKKGAK